MPDVRSFMRIVAVIVVIGTVALIVAVASYYSDMFNRPDGTGSEPLNMPVEVEATNAGAPNFAATGPDTGASERASIDSEPDKMSAENDRTALVEGVYVRSSAGASKNCSLSAYKALG